MGFFNRIMGGQQVDQIPHIRLTDVGTEKLRKLLPGTHEHTFMSSIHEIQPCTVDELAKRTGRSEQNTRAAINEMIRKGYVQRIQ